MTGLDWMYMTPPIKATATTTESTTTMATPTIEQPAHLRPHPGREVAWDSMIEDETHPLCDVHSASGANPGFEAPWDSPITTTANAPIRTHARALYQLPKSSASTTAKASTIPARLLPHPGHEAAWDSIIEDSTHPLHDHHSAAYELEHCAPSGASTPSHAADPGFEAPWDSPITAGRADVPAHLRPHPGHEAPWDSMIEDATHPLHDHHSAAYELEHENHVLSGVSTPWSAHCHAADPGFETPWDSPITPLTPMTPATPAGFEGAKGLCPHVLTAELKRQGGRIEEGYFARKGLAV